MVTADHVYILDVSTNASNVTYGASEGKGKATIAAGVGGNCDKGKCFTTVKEVVKVSDCATTILDNLCPEEL